MIRTDAQADDYVHRSVNDRFRRCDLKEIARLKSELPPNILIRIQTGLNMLKQASILERTAKDPAPAAFASTIRKGIEPAMVHIFVAANESLYKPKDSFLGAVWRGDIQFQLKKADERMLVFRGVPFNDPQKAMDMLMQKARQKQKEKGQEGKAER